MRDAVALILAATGDCLVRRAKDRCAIRPRHAALQNPIREPVVAEPPTVSDLYRPRRDTEVDITGKGTFGDQKDFGRRLLQRVPLAHSPTVDRHLTHPTRRR